MLCQYHPASTECYTFILGTFLCRICPTVSITAVNCTKYGYQDKKSVVPIDPSIFLWAFKCKIPSTPSATVDCNLQQDVAEIVHIVFDKLKETSIRTCDFLSKTLGTTITCNSCFCSAVKEEKLNIVSVPMAGNINNSLEKFLSSELLTLENEWFCLSCITCNESIKDTTIIQFAPVLLIHLRCFCVKRHKFIKDTQFF